MTESNPYAWQSTEAANPNNAELLDEEARHRLAETFESSERPMRIVAGLLMLSTLPVMALTLFLVATGGQFLDKTLGVTKWSSGTIAEWVRMFSVFAVSAAAGIVPFVTGVRLWYSATAVARARKRLTIASVAGAVQVQTVFWRKLASLCTVVLIVMAVLLAVFVALSPAFRG